MIRASQWQKDANCDRTYRSIWLEKLQSGMTNGVDNTYDNNAHMVTVGLKFHI